MTSGVSVSTQLHFEAPSLSRTKWPECVWACHTVSIVVLYDYQACVPGYWEVRHSEFGLRETRQARWVRILRKHWALNTDCGVGLVQIGHNSDE